jgi:hypothetical protein
MSADRSADKHALLRALATSELNIVRARFGHLYRGHLLIDLTAGDAAGDGESLWWRASSPAIFAYIAAKYTLIRVRLYEIEKDTFDRLIENLSRRLPEMGFHSPEPRFWVHADTRSTVRAIKGDSRSIEDYGDMKLREFALVSNDPNSVHSWAMNMETLAKARGPVTSMTTMGCNAHSLKRAVPLENRGPWFERLEAAIALAQAKDSYDVRLMRRLSDFEQFAYLVIAPRKRIFPLNDGMITLSWRDHPREFEQTITELFYSKSEMADGHRWRV